MFSKKKLDFISIICYLIIIILIIILINNNIYNNKYNNNNIWGTNVPPNIINKEAYEKISRYSQNKELAECLADTKYPYVLAAIAKVESDYRPHVKGDGGDSFGLYQIQRKHWGSVGSTIEQQTDKAEAIFSTLRGRSDTNGEAIRRWNGSGKKARIYQQKVIKAIKEIQDA